MGWGQGQRDIVQAVMGLICPRVILYTLGYLCAKFRFFHGPHC